jgi:GTP-binding protein
MNVSYITSAAKPQQFPAESLPEIAFIGRSNSGKSTLINTLTGHNRIARTSRTPGRTQMANFFSCNNRCLLVDLPGYGFAHGAANSMRPMWEKLVTGYLARQSIFKIVFLMDCRREIDEDDMNLLKFIANTHPISVVLTKADKLSRNKLLPKQRKMQEFLSDICPEAGEITAVSCLKKIGIEDLKQRTISAF